MRVNGQAGVDRQNLQQSKLRSSIPAEGRARVAAAVRLSVRSLLGVTAVSVGATAAHAQLGATCTPHGLSSKATLIAGAAATAAVTRLEYSSMTHAARWRVANESDRGAVLADPSSHLHAFGSYQLARVAGSTERDHCASAARAAWTGAAHALSLGVAKEISDGWYSGFSTTDLAVDAMGAGYAVAQAYVPALQHVTPAFSVSPQALRSGHGVLTNYAAQTAWLSADVHDLLPESARNLWPAPVRLSLGRRAFQNATPDQWVLGLDLNASKLPGNNALWRRAKQALASYRLPGPAIVFSGNGTRAVGLYW
jgi:hypothetical protein